jgi:hypothetical protein
MNYDIQAIMRKVNMDMIMGQPNEIVQFFDNLWEKLFVMEYDFLNKGYIQTVYYSYVENFDGSMSRHLVFYVDDSINEFRPSEYYTSIFRRTLREYADISYAINENILNSRSNHNIKRIIFYWDSFEERCINTILNVDLLPIYPGAEEHFNPLLIHNKPKTYGF